MQQIGFRLMLAGMIALLVGLGFGGLQLRRLVSWPRVDATVVSARLVEDVSENSRNHTSTPIFRPEVTFRFDWHGAAHVGRGTASFWSTDQSEARQLMAGFPRGASRAVHVNPENPDEVRYDLASSEGFRVPLYAGGGGAVAFVLGLWLRRRSGQRIGVVRGREPQGST